jgi:PD-(D/E)XK nuclease superfamily
LRNIFDQYTKNENRLSHALASALHLDAALLENFLNRFLHNQEVPKAKSVRVNEQSYPGQASLSDDEAEKAGVPDIWLFDEENSWCSVIESKITAPLYGDQIKSHVTAARKRGFESIIPITISVHPPKNRLPEETVQIRWKEVYSWLIELAKDRNWASLTAKYFEILEAQMVENGQLQEGTLTTFTGFPFANPESYSYLEAKRTLRLALEELRKDKRLIKATCMDPSLSGRGAITGQSEDYVWDYLQIGAANQAHSQKENHEAGEILADDSSAKQANSHTATIHLTLGIHRRLVDSMVTIPHGIDRIARRRLLDLGFDGFLSMLGSITENMDSVLENEPNAMPTLRVMQRRYRWRRDTAPFTDALLAVDMRTAMENSSEVKLQPQWVEAAFSAFAKKNSNLSMQIGMFFPYDRCSLMAEEKALSLISKSWIACKPLFDIVYPDS